MAAVTGALEGYDTLTAAQLLESFVDDLSNWYVRRSRPRFWKASDPGAFAALHESLSAVALMLAPFTPFVADEIYSVLRETAPAGGEVSVHLEDWPPPTSPRSTPASRRRWPWPASSWRWAVPPGARPG